MKKDIKTEKNKDKKRQNDLKEYLKFEFIRINPDRKEFDIHVEIGKIYNHINESITLMN